MNDRINRTSICSVVFLDIIDHSRRPDAEQIEVKNQFNDLINNTLKDFAQNDRIILDTGDGAAIAYMGSPEDALFMAMSIRDGVLKNNESSATLMHVRFGINLGPVRVVQDINGHPNIIGDGINVAQRIMNFAQPNQILVSRSYYEVTSRLTQEISQMFDYSGIKHDKHVREHEVYSVRSTKDGAKIELPEEVAADVLPVVDQPTSLSKINWNYAAPAAFVLVALFAIAKLAFAPKPADITQVVNQPIAAKPVEPIKPAMTPAITEATTAAELAKTKAAEPTKPASNMLANEMPAKQTVGQKKMTSKKRAKSKESSVAEPVSQPVDTVRKQDAPHQQSAKPTDSSHTQVKPSQQAVKPAIVHQPVHKCTQAEIALGQCH